jgi:hypothetical protein
MKLMAAEWLKVRRRPAFIILFLCIGGAGLFVVPILTLLAVRGSYLDEARMGLVFPESLAMSAALIGNVSLIPLIIFSATLAGAEYTGDTWKTLIPRRARRYPFFLAKLFVILITAVVVPLIAVALWTSAGFIGASVAGLPQGALTVPPVEHALRSLAAQGVLWMFMIPASLFGAFVGRSIVGGVLSGLLLLPAVQIFGFLGDSVQRWLPEIHAGHISGAIRGDPGAIAHARDILGGEWPLTGSIAVYGAYVLLLLAIAAITFERRDLAG